MAMPNPDTAPVSPSESPVSQQSPDSEPQPAATPAEPPPSYVKLAMRNMVRKGGTSLFHFALTASALIGVLIGLSYLTR